MRTPYRNAAQLERAIDSFAAQPLGGLIMVPPPPSASNRELINQIALKYATERTTSNGNALWPLMSTAFSAGRSRAICRFSFRPSSSW
jgi:hypothetical protein